jgi:cytochrome c553
MKPVPALISLSLSVAFIALAPLTAARAADTFPQACVSCHIVDHGKDYRLSTALAAWTAGKIDADLLAQTKATMPAGVAVKGKHPKADDALEDIPAACLDCHSSDSKKAPPFTRLMHLVHLTGEKNVFVDMFKGDCRGCHKLDVKTGEWSVPSGTEK